jgi:hypothetical protein
VACSEANDCRWERPAAGGERIVWLWQSGVDRQERLAITECPISYISGDSLAWLEEFYAQQALGSAGEIAAWPARRVEAFALLKGELRKAEMESHGRE